MFLFNCVLFASRFNQNWKETSLAWHEMKMPSTSLLQHPLFCVPNRWWNCELRRNTMAQNRLITSTEHRELINSYMVKVKGLNCAGCCWLSRAPQTNKAQLYSWNICTMFGDVRETCETILSCGLLEHVQKAWYSLHDNDEYTTVLLLDFYRRPPSVETTPLHRNQTTKAVAFRIRAQKELVNFAIAI